MGGQLEWSAVDGGSLTVDGSFPEPSLHPPKGPAARDYDLILGETNAGDAVTLIGCYETSAHGTEKGRTSQTIITDRGLVGCHIDKLGDVRFRQAEFRFAHLAQWAPEVTAIDRSNGVRWRTALAMNVPNATVGDAEIALSLRAEDHSMRREETLREFIGFAYRRKDPVDWKHLEERVWRPLQDLMTFVALESSPLIGLRVRKNEDAIDVINDPWCDALVSGHLVGTVEQDTRRGFLFRLNQFPGGFEKLMPAWFMVCDEFTLPLSLLLASDYAPFSYAERRFAEAVQAVEGYHRQRDQGGPTPEHKERLNRILAVVHEEDRAWLSDRLLNSHEPTLLERLRAVVTEAGPPFEPIVKAWPDFLQAVRDTRNAQTHFADRKDKRIKDPDRLMDAADVLRWALRACLLRKLGFDNATVTGLLDDHPEFQWVRRRA